MTSYHFAILRYVHDVSTEEFVNIGVVMWIPERSKLVFRVNERFSRLFSFFKDIDKSSYRKMVLNLKSAADFKWASDNVATAYLFKNTANHPFEIFHEIVREDASCFQWSRLMSGISKNAEGRFKELFEEFVTSHEPPAVHQRHSETEIWAHVDHALKVHLLDRRVEYGVKLETPSYHYSFRMGWNNGIPQVLEPISFALKKPTSIVDRANTWSGRLFNLSKSNTFGFTAVIAPPENDNMEAFNHGWEILKGARSIRKIITKDEVDDYMSEIASDLSTQREVPILI